MTHTIETEWPQPSLHECDEKTVADKEQNSVAHNVSAMSDDVAFAPNKNRHQRTAVLMWRDKRTKLCASLCVCERTCNAWIARKQFDVHAHRATACEMLRRWINRLLVGVNRSAGCRSRPFNSSHHGFEYRVRARAPFPRTSRMSDWLTEYAHISEAEAEALRHTRAHPILQTTKYAKTENKVRRTNHEKNNNDLNEEKNNNIIHNYTWIHFELVFFCIYILWSIAFAAVAAASTADNQQHRQIAEIRILLSSKTHHRHTSHEVSVCVAVYLCGGALWWGWDAMKFKKKKDNRELIWQMKKNERAATNSIWIACVCADCANERNIIRDELLLLLLPRRIAALLISAYNVLSSVANANVCLRVNTLHITPRSYRWCEIHDEFRT